MNSEVKAKWVAALRSGDYLQGRVRLKAVLPEAPPKFCCLGVLCDLHDKELGLEQSFANESGELPDHVKEWAGLAENNPYIKRKSSYGRQLDCQTHISFLNDFDQLDFIELSNLIEAQL